MKANNINENKYINLKYCYDTGKLFWKVQVAIRSKAGSLAGTKTNNGYIILKLNGINIQAHRVVYELHHGEQDWAAYEIDHINGIKNDNRIENLRLLCPNCHSQTETFSGKALKKKYFCFTCNKKTSRKSTACSTCSSILRRKFNPTRQELEYLIQSHSMVAIGKMFGVSDNAVRKRCIKFGISI